MFADQAPQARSTPRAGRVWVAILAVVNVVWVSIGLALVFADSAIASYSFLVLPQATLFSFFPGTSFFAAVPPGLLLSFVVLITVGIAAALRSRGKPRDLAWFLWKYGTVALFLSLVSGPVVLFAL